MTRSVEVESMDSSRRLALDRIRRDLAMARSRASSPCRENWKVTFLLAAGGAAAEVGKEGGER